MTLVEFAGKALHVPFRDHGRDWSGWDCWGLVVCAYREVLGLELPAYSERYPDAGETPSARSALTALTAEVRREWRAVCEPRAMDVALLRVFGRPIHVGLMIDGTMVLHAERKVGTVAERLAGGMWGDRIEGVYRLG